MLYTRKGDDGTTKVIDSCARFSKNDPRGEALGALDELNSLLGLVKVRAGGVAKIILPGGLALAEVLEGVQQNLFIVQAQVAGDKKEIAQEKIIAMEKTIDAIEDEIPKISGFSIAGGTELSALLDIARTLARKTERRVVALHKFGDRKLTEHTLAYLNRLSSLLFALARLANHRAGIKEKNPHYK